MAIHVKSEVGPLKKVLLKRPDIELEQLVPNSMERLLFDDIPYLRGAQNEHDVFAQTLRDQGVTVVFISANCHRSAEKLGIFCTFNRRIKIV